MLKHTKTELNTLLQHVYDLLMYDIEPDLLLKNIDTLEKKYKKESPEEQKKRRERYRNAIEVFYEKLNTVMQQWKMDMTSVLKNTRSDI